MDEKSFLKGHRYVTVLNDLDKKRVLDVAQNRDEAAAKQVLACLSDTQKDAVEAVAMDMWEPFKNVVEKQIPKADVVHDRFHISGYLTKAVDSDRKGEHRDLTNQGNWDQKQRAQYREMKEICLKVGRAFSMKETFREFWSYSNRGSAHSFFNWWYYWATHS
jgi:transposase